MKINKNMKNVLLLMIITGLSLVNVYGGRCETIHIGGLCQTPVTSTVCADDITNHCAGQFESKTCTTTTKQSVTADYFNFTCTYIDSYNTCCESQTLQNCGTITNYLCNTKQAGECWFIISGGIEIVVGAGVEGGIRRVLYQCDTVMDGQPQAGGMRIDAQADYCP